jgi:hypothetical protein
LSMTGNGVAAPLVSDGWYTNASLLRSLIVLSRERAEREARENALLNHHIAALLGIPQEQVQRQATEKVLASLMLSQRPHTHSLEDQNLERTTLALDNLKDNATALAVAGLVGLSSQNPTSSSSSSLDMEQSSRSGSPKPLKAGKSLESKQKGRVGTFPQVIYVINLVMIHECQYHRRSQSTFILFFSRNCTRCYWILKNPMRVRLLRSSPAAEALLSTSRPNLPKESCQDISRRLGTNYIFLT